MCKIEIILLYGCIQCVNIFIVSTYAFYITLNVLKPSWLEG